jgi:hypothetical protein
MPYEASKAHDFTRKANTGSRSRQWKAVYESSIARGDDEGTAITKASGVTKKNWKKTNPARRKPVDHRPAHMKVGATSPQFVGFAKQAGVGSALRSAGRKVKRALRKDFDMQAAARHSPGGQPMGWAKPGKLSFAPPKDRPRGAIQAEVLDAIHV